MTTIRFNSILLIILVSVSISQSKLIEKSEPPNIGYEADYEIPMKPSTHGMSFIAYIIEQGDLIVKKKCSCISWNQCHIANTIKLSK